MVKGIEEGGMSLEDIRASYGAEGPKLSPASQALCVLKEPEWNVNGLADESVHEYMFVDRCKHLRSSASPTWRPSFSAVSLPLTDFTSSYSDINVRCSALSFST